MNCCGVRDSSYALVLSLSRPPSVPCSPPPPQASIKELVDRQTDASAPKESQ